MDNFLKHTWLNLFFSGKLFKKNFNFWLEKNKKFVKKGINTRGCFSDSLVLSDF